MDREKMAWDVKYFRRNCHLYFLYCIAFPFVMKEYSQKFVLQAVFI